MKILNILVFCAVLAPSLGFHNPAWSESAFQNAFIEGFRSTFVAGFVKGCVSSAKVDAYPKVKAMVARMCDCTGRATLQRITGNELKFINDTTLLEPIIKEEGMACGAKLKEELQKIMKSN